MIQYEYLESALKFWPFHEAPDEFQYLANYDADGEWVFFIPSDYIGSMPPSHDGWPDLSIDVERAILRLTDTVDLQWHEVNADGDWVAISSRG